MNQEEFEKQTIVQLKALAYDSIKRINAENNSLNVIENRIAQLATEQANKVEEVKTT